MIRILLIAVTCVSPIFCLAEISLNSVFSDGAVLQREIPLKFWGNGKPGETVVVSFNKDERTTTVKRDTRWSVTFESKSASIRPKTLQVESEGETIVISDLLVGDVWLCSGQSNMGFKLAKCDGGETDVAGATDHLLRVNNYRDTWKPCVSEVVAETSGVAYYFGRRLREKNKDIPVGLIVRALSGTPIEVWTPVEDLGEIDFAGPGYWNDPDMMATGPQGLSQAEQESHFALWCIMSSPLMIGSDPRTMDKKELAMLTNKDAIAIKQDPTEQGRKVQDRGLSEIWSKNLVGGKVAVLLLNRNPYSDVTINLDGNLVGLKGKWSAHNVYTGEKLTVKDNFCKAEIPSGSSIFFITE